jgi:dipeptidyl aminopeptidase/acylaminoacyl peptidase
MKRICVAFAAVVFAGMNAHAAPPVSAYGQLPSIDQVAISADGKNIALLRGENQYSVEVRDTAAFALRGQAVPEAGAKFRGVTWSEDGHLLVRASATYDPFANEVAVGSHIGARREKDTTYEFSRIVVLSSTASDPVVLLANDSGLINVATGPARPGTASEPGAVRVGKYTRRGAFAAWTLFRADLSTGKGEVIARGNEHTNDFILNGASEIVGRVDDNDVRNTWTLYAAEGDGWRALQSETNETGADPIIPFTFPDGRFAAIRDGENQDRMALFAIDPRTGASTKLFEDARYDIDGAIVDPHTNVIVGAEYTADFPKQEFFDAQLKSVSAALAKKFPNTYAILEDWDRARASFIVRAQSGPGPASYYLYRPAGDQLMRLGPTYAGLDDAASGQRLALTFKARDGVPIPAYLTTPAGAALKNLPLVVLVHGGPELRDDFSFDWWAAFLASRGYGVLQPNFRGSSGYGRDWARAGYGQWGKLMQNDVSDGVNAMIKAGIADPRRICIVGASYGGYAALAGAAFTPELYRCAVSVSGPSDLAQMLIDEKNQHGRKSAAVDYWKLSIGANTADAKAASPIEAAARVKAPVLILHGRDDTVVPFDQSAHMVSALRDAGKPVTFVELKGDDHWLSFSETRTQMLSEIEKFLAENLN